MLFIIIVLIWYCSSKSETLPIEGHLNFSAIAISPDGCLLIMVNEGEYVK